MCKANVNHDADGTLSSFSRPSTNAFYETLKLRLGQVTGNRNPYDFVDSRGVEVTTKTFTVSFNQLLRHFEGLREEDL